MSGIDLALVEDATRRITIERDAFRADQFSHPGNADAHFRTTGPELWQDSDETLTALVDFAGSGGTFGGTMRALRDRNPTLRGYVVEPEGAAILSGKTVDQPGHPIQGGGYAIDDLPLLKDVPVDGYIAISGDEARAMTQALAREEGIFAGFSAGANVAAALGLLTADLAGETIAVIIGDSGLKYLSTDLWD
ncbi:MAG: pyridoxal-phosphate dependent enzyme [Rhodobacteraceae bacterium]|nr:pyridoxal-phosphate dependent enzyme [Paracoccaceae bacterium]